MATTTTTTNRSAQTRLQAEELAEVVVAAETRDRPDVRWHVRLRAWIFCLMFLFIAEGAARYTFDYNLALHHERFDNFPNTAALDAYVNEIKHDSAFRIVVIGDSVVVGPSLLDKDETIPEYLEAELQRRFPRRPIHVWNLAIAGARAADEHLLLLRALEAKPDMVVVEGNLMVFTENISRMPLANTWLADGVTDVPADIRPYLPSRNYKEQIDASATAFVEGHVRLFGLRQAINGILFGVQPRSPIDAPNPGLMAATKLGKRLGKLRMERWDERGVVIEGYRPMYSDPVRDDSLNGRLVRSLLQTLRQSGIPAFTYLTPQNPALLDSVLPPLLFREYRQTAMSFFADPLVPSRDYSELLSGDLFYDNDHLLPAGNHAVATRIADDIAPRVARLISSRPETSAAASLPKTGVRPVARSEGGRAVASSSRRVTTE